MKLKKLALATAVGVCAMATSASAHLWNIGWKSENAGLTFYGVSWHGDAYPGQAGSVDDFVSRPAGFVINGTNVTFDANSVVDLFPNFTNTGQGGLTSGTVSSIWNNLNLDGAIASSSYPSNNYGKIASRSLTSAELANLGIGQGNNSVTLGSFSDNVHWANTPFASATVPINIVVVPPSAVPLPAGMPLVAAGLGAFGFLGWRRKRKAA